jgi:hypothetical protein
MTKLGQDTGRPVWFLLTDRPTDMERWKRLMVGVHAARAAGAMVTAQVAGRPVGVLLGADTALNPFSIRPSYQELLKLPPLLLPPDRPVAPAIPATSKPASAGFTRDAGAFGVVSSAVM